MQYLLYIETEVVNSATQAKEAGISYWLFKRLFLVTGLKMTPAVAHLDVLQQEVVCANANIEAVLHF